MFPLRRVLAAVDFSESSRVALNAAARLAAHTHADLVVLHALDPLLAQAARASGVQLAEDTDAELAQFIAAAAPGTRAARVVIAGKAAEIICQGAERESADVIVIGAHGMSGVGHAVFGSTTERVLREARVSVFVVPVTWTAGAGAPNLAGVGPVIAGVVLTSAGAAAASAASELAALLRTRLELLHVVPPVAALNRWKDVAERAVAETADHARSELALLAGGLRPDVPTEIRVEVGSVAERLVHAVARHSDSGPVLVLGRNPAAHGGATGSIAYRVLMQGGAPVLVYLPND